MPDTNTLIANVKGLANAMGTALCTTNGNVATNTTAIATLRSDMATAISDAVTAAKTEILGGASDAYDTLKEIEDLLKGNDDLIAALQALNVVHYDSQTLTSEQQAQARSNIGAAAASDVTGLGSGVVRHDEDQQTLAAANQVRARSNIGAAGEADLTALAARVTTAEGDIDALETLIGDGTDIDFVSTFNTALNGGGNGGGD